MRLCLMCVCGGKSRLRNKAPAAREADTRKQKKKKWEAEKKSSLYKDQKKKMVKKAINADKSREEGRKKKKTALSFSIFFFLSFPSFSK